MFIICLPLFTYKIKLCTPVRVLSLLMNVTALKDHIRPKASSYFVKGSYTGRGSNHNRVKGACSFMSSKGAVLTANKCTHRNTLLTLHSILQCTHSMSRAPAMLPHRQNAPEGACPKGKVPTMGDHLQWGAGEQPTALRDTGKPEPTCLHGL